jgi:hypothetical protein
VSGTRKIAAILVADIVGYSRLAGTDEDRTLSRLRGLRSDLMRNYGNWVVLGRDDVGKRAACRCDGSHSATPPGGGHSLRSSGRTAANQ